MSADKTGLDLMIEDNGVGLKGEPDAIRDPGMGMQNIRSRVQYLHGTVEWSSGPEGGTVVAIHIPATP
jgi:signal transduction histidine kinase